jgi:hypothetical protein
MCAEASHFAPYNTTGVQKTKPSLSAKPHQQKFYQCMRMDEMTDMPRYPVKNVSAARSPAGLGRTGG